MSGEPKREITRAEFAFKLSDAIYNICCYFTKNFEEEIDINAQSEIKQNFFNTARKKLREINQDPKKLQCAIDLLNSCLIFTEEVIEQVREKSSLNGGGTVAAGYIVDNLQKNLEETLHENPEEISNVNSLSKWLNHYLPDKKAKIDSSLLEQIDQVTLALDSERYKDVLGNVEARASSSGTPPQPLAAVLEVGEGVNDISLSDSDISLKSLHLPSGGGGKGDARLEAALRNSAAGTPLARDQAAVDGSRQSATLGTSVAREDFTRSVEDFSEVSVSSNSMDIQQVISALQKAKNECLDAKTRYLSSRDSILINYFTTPNGNKQERSDIENSLKEALCDFDSSVCASINIFSAQQDLKEKFLINSTSTTLGVKLELLSLIDDEQQLITVQPLLTDINQVTDSLDKANKDLYTLKEINLICVELENYFNREMSEEQNQIMAFGIGKAIGEFDHISHLGGRGDYGNQQLCDKLQHCGFTEVTIEDFESTDEIFRKLMEAKAKRIATLAPQAAEFPAARSLAGRSDLNAPEAEGTPEGSPTAPPRRGPAAEAEGTPEGSPTAPPRRGPAAEAEGTPEGSPTAPHPGVASTAAQRRGAPPSVAGVPAAEAEGTPEGDPVAGDTPRRSPAAEGTPRRTPIAVVGGTPGEVPAAEAEVPGAEGAPAVPLEGSPTTAQRGDPAAGDPTAKVPRRGTPEGDPTAKVPRRGTPEGDPTSLPEGSPALFPPIRGSFAATSLLPDEAQSEKKQDPSLADTAGNFPGFSPVGGLPLSAHEGYYPSGTPLHPAVPSHSFQEREAYIQQQQERIRTVFDVAKIIQNAYTYASDPQSGQREGFFLPYLAIDKKHPPESPNYYITRFNSRFIEAINYLGILISHPNIVPNTIECEAHLNTLLKVMSLFADQKYIGKIQTGLEADKKLPENEKSIEIQQQLNQMLQIMARKQDGSASDLEKAISDIKTNDSHQEYMEFKRQLALKKLIQREKIAQADPEENLGKYIIKIQHLRELYDLSSSGRPFLGRKILIIKPEEPTTFNPKIAKQVFDFKNKIRVHAIDNPSDNTTETITAKLEIGTNGQENCVISKADTQEVIGHVTKEKTYVERGVDGAIDDTKYNLLISMLRLISNQNPDNKQRLTDFSAQEVHRLLYLIHLEHLEYIHACQNSNPLKEKPILVQLELPSYLKSDTGLNSLIEAHNANVRSLRAARADSNMNDIKGKLLQKIGGVSVVEIPPTINPRQAQVVPKPPGDYGSYSGDLGRGGDYHLPGSGSSRSQKTAMFTFGGSKKKQ